MTMDHSRVTANKRQSRENSRMHRTLVTNTIIITLASRRLNIPYCYVEGYSSSSPFSQSQNTCCSRTKLVRGSVSLRRLEGNNIVRLSSSINGDVLPPSGLTLIDDTKKTMLNDGSNLPNNLLPSTVGLARSKGGSQSALPSSVLVPSTAAIAAAKARRTASLDQTLNGQSTTPADSKASIANSAAEASPQPAWKDRLVDISNIASLLCVLDCTLLPLVSVAFPALSWIAGLLVGLSSGASLSASASSGNGPLVKSLSTFGNQFQAALPAIGHSIALYFVIPVGSLTTAINYFYGHRKIRFTIPPLLGLCLIYAANASHGIGIPVIDTYLQSMGIMASHHSHVHESCVAATASALTAAASASKTIVGCGGWAHRLANTLGCALLLGSNYASRKFMRDNNSGKCAASAFAEVWRGGSSSDYGTLMCGPNCDCNRPLFGMKSSDISEDMFFQWEKRRSGEKGRGIGKGAAWKHGIFSFLRR